MVTATIDSSRYRRPLRMARRPCAARRIGDGGADGFRTTRTTQLAEKRPPKSSCLSPRQEAGQGHSIGPSQSQLLLMALRLVYGVFSFIVLC